jgi:hypothetical protein
MCDGISDMAMLVKMDWKVSNGIFLTLDVQQRLSIYT